MPEELTGVLERVIFFNEENGYFVGELSVEEQKGPITVQGNIDSPQCGETLELKGGWTVTKYGQQFKFTHCKAVLPASIYGVQKFLSSGIVKGIGEKLAEKIVKKFGVDVFRILNEESGRLKEIRGLGVDKAKALKSAWTEHQLLRESSIYLHTLGLGSAMSAKLIKRFGSAIKRMIEDNPYALIGEVDRLGFKTIDQVALNAGVSSHSKERLKAGLEFAVSQAEEDGNTAMEREELIQAASRLLEVRSDELEMPLIEMLETNQLQPLEETTLVQTPKMARHERIIAQHLNRVAKGITALPSIDAPKALKWAQERAKIILTEEQMTAVQGAIENKIFILTGGPGTGKTTVLRTLIEILRAKKVLFHLASPTGRAAQRMNEATGAPAQTIHRLLKYDPATGKWTHNEKEPLETHFLIVDESSMIDTSLMSGLMRAIPDGAHLLLVGDADQLPSVGPGEILHNLIESKKIPVARLKRIFRQNEGLLLRTAHALMEGSPIPPIYKQDIEDFDKDVDLHAFAAASPEETVEKIVALCKSIPKKMGLDVLNDIQILVPMHKGEAGTINLNAKLQAALNADRPGMTIGGTRISVGDKLLQTRNNYEKMLFNGDIGRVESFDALSRTLSANFSGQRVTLGVQELTDTTLAYAISIHKSQGSEYPCVIIPLLKAHFAMLTRNLLYTAITRGRKQVIIVGDPAAYKLAAGRVETNTRTTGLLHWIRVAE